MERMKIALLYKIEKFHRNGMMIGQIDIAFCMRSWFGYNMLKYSYPD